MMTTAEAERNGLRGKFHELQTVCLAVQTDMPAGLGDIVDTAKRSITL